MSKIQIKSVSAGIQVTVVGAIVNILLAIIKFIFGILGNSRALVADAVHSMSDLASDIVVILGLHFGDQPADKDHHFGHKKIETVTEIVLGVLLLSVAFKLAYDAAFAIINQEYSHPTAITIIAAAISVVSKEWLFRWTKAVGIKHDSRAILANAWHHRSDALSSVAVLAGLVFIQISPELAVLDSIASLIVSVLIVKVGWDILLEGYKRIIDTAPPPSYVEEINKIIEKYPGATNPHKLRMRYIGNAIHMEVHIEVAPDMTVKEGHDIAAGIKHKILKHDNRVLDVTVHIEPEGEAAGN
ncbi:MAG: cation transporter [candidate division Zixibacteria bacterium]|nr:cation transporter [candidate division Zixibacteria bacterium]